ncbi:hypothetical protein [Streptomyces sp. NPDC058861]|uniref:hypothetical protein n=1 Tax=Streptomyces sp. NPDC058861 TaxID=3346653 RepID=UPI0036B2371C
MSNYQRPQPNRKLMLVEFPAGTHLDRSRASSGGMRGTARDDRDNSLVAQAELFDADDRYDEGYRDGLRNLFVNCATDIAVEVARTVTVAAVEVATPYLKDGARRFKEKLRRRPKDTPAAEVVQEVAPERPTASGLRPETAAANGRDQVDLVLRADQGDANVQAALERINTRAAETYGIAAHYSAGLPAADVARAADAPAGSRRRARPRRGRRPHQRQRRARVGRTLRGREWPLRIRLPIVRLRPGTVSGLRATCHVAAASGGLGTGG